VRLAYIQTYDTEEDYDSVVSDTWKAVIGDRSLKIGYWCEYDLAEEIIGCMIFHDGTCEVGIGEVLRPYEKLYLGDKPEVGFERWMQAVVLHTTRMGE